MICLRIPADKTALKTHYPFVGFENTVCAIRVAERDKAMVLRFWVTKDTYQFQGNRYTTVQPEISILFTVL